MRILPSVMAVSDRRTVGTRMDGLTSVRAEAHDARSKGIWNGTPLAPRGDERTPRWRPAAPFPATFRPHLVIRVPRTPPTRQTAPGW